VARCSHCHKQISLTANTPFQNTKLPLSYISFILQDQILQYPKVVTSQEIARKLNLPYNTAYFLKKRIQVFLSLLNLSLKKQLYQELEEASKEVRLPLEGDLKKTLMNQPVAVADSVVLYSSSLRANKHRSRRYKTGTSSIYLSNSLGGEQKGVLVHTVGINHGMTFYKSIPLNHERYLAKDLDDKIPKNTILFTDEGYTFIWDRKNHRMVNHSKKSNDPRYNLSRERWVTKEGVSSNGAEARNNILKQSFRSYHYISPKWSQLYLDEMSFLGNVRYSEGLRNLLLGSREEGEFVWDVNENCSQYYEQSYSTLERFLYTPLTLQERIQFKERRLINELKEVEMLQLSKGYKFAILRNDHFWKNHYDKDRMRRELNYNQRAFKIHSHIEPRKWCDAENLSHELQLDKREIMFIAKKWKEYGLCEVIERKERYRIKYKIRTKKLKLYYLLYSS